jgi:hypothetical protein
MRLPAADVAGTLVAAMRAGRPGIEGAVRGVPDVPGALLRRRTVPAPVRADLRRLAAGPRA